MYAGEYGGILLGLGLCLVLAIVFAGLSYAVSAKQADVEKVSAYECGFDPFVGSRNKFEVKFFLIGILFLVFDLEISLLFPWAQIVIQSNFWIIIIFLLILTIGLVYEWNKGALEWE